MDVLWWNYDIHATWYSVACPPGKVSNDPERHACGGGRVCCCTVTKTEKKHGESTNEIIEYNWDKFKLIGAVLELHGSMIPCERITLVKVWTSKTSFRALVTLGVKVDEPPRTRDRSAEDDLNSQKLPNWNISFGNAFGFHEISWIA